MTVIRRLPDLPWWWPSTHSFGTWRIRFSIFPCALLAGMRPLGRRGSPRFPTAPEVTRADGLALRLDVWSWTPTLLWSRLGQLLAGTTDFPVPPLYSLCTVFLSSASLAVPSDGSGIVEMTPSDPALVPPGWSLRWWSHSSANYR